MKEIPNKIFIDEDLIAYYSLTDRHDGDLEYIRKDALLNLLNEYKNNPVITELQKDNIQELIEKIESL